MAWLLCYPDTYEIGLPNQGLQILYEILNERDDAVAERTYAPWVDLEGELRNAGVPLFSLNTDASVMPLEELFLQGAMSSRLGGDAYTMLKALTINTAKTFGIDDRVGSLEAGKDADVVVFAGDPLDPRSSVERVWIEGNSEYERERGKQRF